MKIKGLMIEENDTGFIAIVKIDAGPRGGVEQEDADDIAAAINDALAAFRNGGHGPGAAAAPEPEPAPASRRRRGGGEAQSTGSASGGTATASAGAGTDAGNGRRRRAGASTETSQQAPAAAPATAQAGGDASGTTRRRRTAEPAAEAGISDADVVKAASDAARTITPKVVEEILVEFGKTDVKALTQDDRKEFIELLNNEMQRQGA